MTNDQRHSIFTLLYAVVLIDNRVIRAETDQFFLTLENFLIRISLADTLKAKSYISNWFVQNYKEILSEMKSPDRNTYLMRHVESLKTYKNRQIVFDMMEEIALADNEYHPLEKQLIDRISEAWSL